METKNNTTSSRESEMRSKTKRKTDWTPPSSLDAPPAPQGLVQRWIRAETMGFMDSANVSKALREGWEFVRAEQIVKEIGPHDYPTIQEGKHKGIIGLAAICLQGYRKRSCNRGKSISRLKLANKYKRLIMIL